MGYHPFRGDPPQTDLVWMAPVHPPGGLKKTELGESRHAATGAPNGSQKGPQKGSKIDPKAEKWASEGAPESDRISDGFRSCPGTGVCASSTVNSSVCAMSALLQKVRFRSPFGPLLGALLGAFGKKIRFKSRLKKVLKK